MKRWVSLLSALLLAALAAADDPLARSVLWREPKRMTVQDWTCGPGGCDQAPAPPFRFQAEDFSGSSPKVTVVDAHGRTWSIKFGAEVIPECFGSRFVTAVGYLAEPTYFVASGKVEGAGKLGRARRFVHKDGSFARGRFEGRSQPDFVFLRGTAWRWDQSPFAGTREFAGLKIVVMLLSNWDAKDTRDSDSAIGAFRVPDNGGEIVYHGVFKWGGSLGRWGNALHRDRSDVAGYTDETPEFVKGVSGNTVEWGFRGKHDDDLTSGITTDDVRWLLPYLQRITPEEMRAGLRASGATQRQAACWTNAIGARIGQLRAIAK
jgi:hypothetical protein